MLTMLKFLGPFIQKLYLNQRPGSHGFANSHESYFFPQSKKKQAIPGTGL
jgi:hypothetical protein